MPIYEYQCLDCTKRISLLVLTRSQADDPSCSHCSGRRLQRLLSRFASPKSEEARLNTLAESGELDSLSEDDPQSTARLMKQLRTEVGGDAGEELELETASEDGVETDCEDQENLFDSE